MHLDVTGDSHRITELADGLRVVTERVPGTRCVALGAWIGVGSRHEDEACSGYAHFLEHLLFKGNERIDAAGISRWFDGIGSDVNAATTRDYTVVHARVLERHVPRSLEVLGEMVVAPGLLEHDVDAERQVILEEIAMYEDSPSDVVHELADDLVFHGHPLGRPIVGTTESITRARVDEIARFHDRAYAPGNVVISAAGAVEHDAFVREVQERFGSLRLRSVRPAVNEPWATPAAPGAHEACVETRVKDTEQTHIVLAGRGIHRQDERRYAASLLDTIFGNAPSSRLFLQIRELRGLAYSVYSYLSHHAEAGQCGIYVGVRPDRLAAVFEVLRAELDAIVAQPPKPEELELAKGHVEGRMVLSSESSVVRGNRLGASLVVGVPIEPLERTIERIQAVTAQDIYELARELYDPAKLSLAVVAEDVDSVCAAAADVGMLPDRVVQAALS